MSKKSKKRKKSKRLSSSSSSEEDKKASKEQDVSEKSRRSKRRQDDDSRERCSHAARREHRSSSRAAKDVSPGDRHIKTPVYRLAQTRAAAAADHKTVRKEDERSETKSARMPFHGEDRSSKARHRSSEKNGSKSVEKEREASKPRSSGRDRRTASGGKTEERKDSKHSDKDGRKNAERESAKRNSSAQDERISVEREGTKPHSSGRDRRTVRGSEPLGKEATKHNISDKDGRHTVESDPSKRSISTKVRRTLTENKHVERDACKPLSSCTDKRTFTESKTVQSKATKLNISPKDGCETGVSLALSKPRKSPEIDMFSERKDESPERNLEQKPSWRSLEHPISPSLSSTDLKEKEQTHNEPEREFEKKAPPSTGNENTIFAVNTEGLNRIEGDERGTTTVKNEEWSKIEDVKDDAGQSKIKLFKEMCRKHQEMKLKAKQGLSGEAAKTTAKPSAIIAKHTALFKSTNWVKNLTPFPSNAAPVSFKIAKPTSGTSAKQTTSFRTSKLVKNVPSIPEDVVAVSSKIASSLSDQISAQTSSRTPLPSAYKIPKIVRPKPEDSSVVKGDGDGASTTDRSVNIRTKLSDAEASISSADEKPEIVRHAEQIAGHSDVSPSGTAPGQDEWHSDRIPTASDAATEPWDGQMQVVEELHLARSDRRLELDVMQSYGELTGMDIDPPQGGATHSNSHCQQPPQQDLILALDTNVLLSHLDYVKRIRYQGLGALGMPVVLVPWVVLQELDSLKKGRGLSGSVAHLATPAISYIYTCLKNREERLWGQSMQQAAQSCNGLKAENNDDRVLQCCLQYQSLYPEVALILCTNDKNLCSKGLLSGVNALSQKDLEAQVDRSRRLGFSPLSESPVPPHVHTPTPSLVHPQSHNAGRHEQGRPDAKWQGKAAEEEQSRPDLRIVPELEECLRAVLSDVLEAEMKAAYDQLWLEIVIVKPPWTLQDVLHCLKKHWIAVFGQIVPRRNLQNVLNLIQFFNSGQTVDLSSSLAALHEAKELVKAFGESSSGVPAAVSLMDNMINNLQPQRVSPACDVIMNEEEEEDGRPSSPAVSNHEVWSLFEHIWTAVFQISLEVFRALCFDPLSQNNALPAGRPPQDVLLCLDRLSSSVQQLLHAFSCVLSSAPGPEEIQTLFTILHSIEFVQVDSRLTTDDLLDCFSQQEYREKLRVGGNQLNELKEALERCFRTSVQPFNTQ